MSISWATPVFLLQASFPSPHVCANAESPARPHSPSQEPPFAQQVGPFGLGTHLKHSENACHLCLRIIPLAFRLAFIVV